MRGFIALISLLPFVCSASPPWYSPPKGSAERAQIMDALRAKLSILDPVNQSLVFVVSELCVSSAVGWLSVEPRSREGRNRLEPIQAVIQRSKSGWKVSALACTEEDCPVGADSKALRAKINPRCA